MRLYRVPFLRPLFLAYWRARERDVLDARSTTGSGKSAPDYEYGKVTGLRPDLVVINETSESPYVCCGYCSAAMAVRAAREGTPVTMSGAAHPIRSDGGRPHDNGSKASELRNGAARAWDVDLDPLAKSEIPERLRAGYAVVINLDYADLPGWLKVQGGSFGHSCTLFGWREDGDYVGFFDPLWPQGARGAWAPWSSIKGALWADGEHSSTLTKWAADEPPPPPPEPPCYSEAELDAAEARAHTAGVVDGIAQGVVLAGDEAVGDWLDWLRAPRPAPSDRWDVGSWAGDEELVLDVDPCEAPELAAAAWSRGGLLPPVSDAIAAWRIPAAWDTSDWRAAAWQ